MYSKLPNLVLGFHGCDNSVAEKVLCNHQPLKASENDYDWLGHGIYFWEHSLERALEWAVELSKRPKSKIKTPSAIGAVIDLGYCLNMTESANIKKLRNQYEIFKSEMNLIRAPMPENRNAKGNTDLLLRFLDCAVIENLHEELSLRGKTPFDSVRGVFVEGDAIYSGSGFRDKTHIQICVRNPNCIKGYFHPTRVDGKFSIP